MSREIQFSGDIGRELARVVKNEVTESILRRLKGVEYVFICTKSALLEQVYSNTNTKMNIFSLERIPDKDKIFGSGPERRYAKHIYKYIISGSNPLSPSLNQKIQ